MDEHAKGVQQSIESIIGADTILKRRKKTEDDINRDIFEKIIIALEQANVRSSIIGGDFKLDFTSYDETFYEIIEEQLSLIKKHFDFPYTLNVGISIAKENQSISHILEMVDGVRDIRAMGNEFTTLELIEKDKQNFGDSDYILYIHTKGASKQNDVNFKNIISWRHLMNYFNIEKAKDVFKLFERTDFNTHGVLYGFHLIVFLILQHKEESNY